MNETELHVLRGVMDPVTDISSDSDSVVSGFGVPLTALAMLAGAALVYWQLDGLEKHLVESNAVESASNYAVALEEFRTLYTSEVIANLKGYGVEITHDYASKEGAIPLPATLSILLGNRLAERGGGVTRLYSDHPFPWRKSSGGPQDEFEVDALLALRKDSNRPF